MRQCDQGITYDNLGAALMDARLYHLAILSEQKAIDLGAYIDWTCLRLTSAIWATTKDRDRTLKLLRRGAAVCRSEGLDLKSQTELTEVSEDPEFLEAAKRPGK